MKTDSNCNIFARFAVCLAGLLFSFAEPVCGIVEGKRLLLNNHAIMFGMLYVLINICLFRSIGLQKWQYLLANAFMLCSGAFLFLFVNNSGYVAAAYAIAVVVGVLALFVPIRWRRSSVSICQISEIERYGRLNATPILIYIAVLIIFVLCVIDGDISIVFPLLFSLKVPFGIIWILSVAILFFNLHGVYGLRYSAKSAYIANCIAGGFVANYIVSGFLSAKLFGFSIILFPLLNVGDGVICGLVLFSLMFMVVLSGGISDIGKFKGYMSYCGIMLSRRCLFITIVSLVGSALEFCSLMVFGTVGVANVLFIVSPVLGLVVLCMPFRIKTLVRGLGVMLIAITLIVCSVVMFGYALNDDGCDLDLLVVSLLLYWLFMGGFVIVTLYKQVRCSNNMCYRYSFVRLSNKIGRSQGGRSNE